ncbi:MAG: DUF1738 domain-containing protein [Lentisphaerae bacterium]|jgi:antirestriction protein ArdC|nr:DUF1738 domain-containing protein [Lentisphaerota bacterium]MBT4822129.1 DUF1738 domain-containing protein [Lentisphaerota bacterium]MBT5610532.1 DUF1738 domain-containing protein [Lentisphaerota bacterium]MBT7056087.1 DUF1738 domain-containing protein [Lentisphaerota bacterium]MBT7842444.1 DUF1738 domain-containing protein [Lentisphaerota bacterium]
MKPRKDVYQIITDRIIAQLESGVVPWHRPWTETSMPRNLASDRPYHGINAFLLTSTGYDSPHWLTWNQLKRLGGSVRSGEKACPIVFWKRYERETEERDAAGNPVVESRAFLRYFSVFNTTQCEGIDEHVPEPELPSHDFSPVGAAEAVVAGMPKCPTIEHGFRTACYSPLNDSVRMPRRERFNGPEAYYATLFHELTHSTGHASRLGREGIAATAAFGSDRYSAEELIAEMGAAFICGHAGIETATIDNSAAYIHHWMQRLRDDRRLIVRTAAQAQKAADFVLGTARE